MLKSALSKIPDTVQREREIHKTAERFKPDYNVLARFAIVFRNSSSMKKTQMHLASRIRWNSFVKYLNWLEINGYMESKVSGNQVRYILTQEGTEMFQRLLGFLECVKMS